MILNFTSLSAEDANTIVNWHYDGIYKLYDFEQDPVDMAKLLNPRSWVDCYYAVTNELKELVGFFCFYREKDEISIGLGLRPDLTGKGLGYEFFNAGLDFAREKYHPTFFMLNVATFNKRAISVYRKAGFIDAEIYMNETNGGQFEFLKMTMQA